MNLITSSDYFATWSKFIKLADSTKKQYTYSLEHFGDYLLERGFTLSLGEKLDFDKFYYSDEEDEYEPIDLEFFLEYVEYLQENKSTHAVEHHLTALKNFLHFLESMELIEDNPLSRFRGSFYDRPLKNRALNKEQSEELLEASYHIDPFFKQWFVLLLLQLKCGLRASELCKLTVSQINFELNTIVINKGQKSFTSSVQMTKTLAAILRSYLTHPSYLNWKGDDDDKEVFFYNNKPLTPFKLNTILKSIVAKTAIKRKVTCHDLRATMAYLLYIEGINERVIQSQLRHKKLATTLLYLPVRNKLLS